MKKVTNKKTKRIASALAALSLVSAMAIPAAAISASAAETPAIVEEVSILDNETQLDVEAEDKDEKPSYNGHAIKDIKYSQDGTEHTFKYSEGCFETDPNKYDPHLATMSSSLAHASDTYTFDNEETKKKDYSKGAQRVVDILNQAGFEEKDIYVSDSYRVKPTTDSVACVIASKDIKTEEGDKKLISITVRSSSYEAEWASNVTLGTEGEAAGFANAANQVIGYFNDFNSDGKFDEALANGDVIFWVQGYSRGGATANLTSKRLIDAYQADGNEVYGYCIEAPQGGVKDAEDPDRNYNSIHNVINPDDLVPYVAPTAMGFKRYGVDHFMFGGDADSDNILPWTGQFGNNAADNYAKRIIDMDAQKTRMMRQLRNIVKGDTTNCEPFEMTPYNYDSVGNLVDAVINRVSRKVGRENYERDMQEPLRRVMQFINSGKDLDEIQNRFGITATIASSLCSCLNDPARLPELLGIAGSEIKVVSANQTTETGVKSSIRRLWDICKSLLPFTEKSTKYVANFSDYSCCLIADTVVASVDYILISDFNDYPSNGELSGYETAKQDIKSILFYVLKGTHEIDDTVELAKNIEKIFQNHSSIQTMSWLRSFDSWYDDISEGRTGGATGTWDYDISEDITGGATGSW